MERVNESGADPLNDPSSELWSLPAHDCATLGHRWQPYIRTFCAACGEHCQHAKTYIYQDTECCRNCRWILGPNDHGRPPIPAPAPPALCGEAGEPKAEPAGAEPPPPWPEGEDFRLECRRAVLAWRAWRAVVPVQFGSEDYQRANEALDRAWAILERHEASSG